MSALSWAGGVMVATRDLKSLGRNPVRVRFPPGPQPMKKPFIPLILGTAREGRESEKVARFVYDEFIKLNLCETQFIDVRDFLFGKTVDDSATEVKAWQDIALKADGFFIVTPEYNHSFPGELKIFLDSLYDEYKGKPVALCGVSSGQFGGARMIDHVKTVLIELGMVTLRSCIQVPKVEEVSFVTGSKDSDVYKKRVITLVEELVQMATLLKKTRKI